MTRTIVLFAVIAVAVLSCSKEKSFETGKDISGDDSTTSAYGWSFTANSASLSGCVDTAYFTSASDGARVLTIEGSDTAGNAFVIVLGSATGDITAGTYTASQGAGMVVADKDGNTWTSATPDSFTITIKSISETEVSAEFSGNLSNADTTAGGTYSLSSGKAAAVVGGVTPC
jgi:hypothetical protein